MFEAASWLLERRAQAREITERELELRHLDLDEGDRLAVRAREALTRWVRALEFTLVLAALQEVVLRLGLSTEVELEHGGDRVATLVATITRLDVARVLRENQDAIARLPTSPSPEAATQPVDVSVLNRSVESLLAHCPIETIELVGHEQELASLAHRCRVTFDALRALVARTSHPAATAMHAAGTAYAEGRLSVDEVAALLSMPAHDVVALLEEQGFHRSIEGLRLSDSERSRRLATIREDRLSRGGQPTVNETLVVRDVIASQRIEDIDARSWLRP